MKGQLTFRQKASRRSRLVSTFGSGQAREEDLPSQDGRSALEPVRVRGIFMRLLMSWVESRE